jgi:hypothetical protein
MQSKALGLVFEVSLSEETPQSRPLYEQLNQQVLAHFANNTQLSWAETELDTTQYEHFNWRMVFGGNRPSREGMYQKIRLNEFVERHQFTLLNLENISKKVTNPCDPEGKKRLLILGQCCLFSRITAYLFGSSQSWIYCCA